MRLDLKYSKGRHCTNSVGEIRVCDVNRCEVRVDLGVDSISIEAIGKNRADEEVVLRAIMGIFYVCWGYFPVKRYSGQLDVPQFMTLGMYKSLECRGYKIRDIDEEIISKRSIEKFIDIDEKNIFMKHIFALTSENYQHILLDHRLSLMINAGEGLVDCCNLTKETRDYLVDELEKQGVYKQKPKNKDLWLSHKIFYIINKHVSKKNIRLCKSKYYKFFFRLTKKGHRDDGSIHYFSKVVADERNKVVHIKKRGVKTNSKDYTIIFYMLYIVYRCEILRMIGYKEDKDRVRGAFSTLGEIIYSKRKD